MNRKQVSCASIIEQTKDQFVIFHQQLGCFCSDWHQHAWGQLVYAEKGCVHLNSQDKIILIPSLHGVWIPANTYHQIWSDSAQMHIRSICFSVVEPDVLLSGNISVFSVSSLLLEMIRYTQKWSQLHQQDISQVDTFLKVIQSILPDEIRKSIPVYLPSTSNQKLLAIIHYIDQHLSAQISFQDLANSFSVSERSLRRLFMGQLGISFSSYCKKARIMKALELIEMGNDCVSELASQVGYESLATFSNNFLEICGHRPLHFIRSKTR